MILFAALSLASIQAVAGTSLVSTTPPVDVQPDPALDLRLSGFPLQGQPLDIEVRGAAGASFAVRVDYLAGLTAFQPSRAALPDGAFAGARAADVLTRLLAEQSVVGLVLRGTTDAHGVWHRSLEAPIEGTLILARGYEMFDGAAHEFEALELDIIPAYVARPADVSVHMGAQDQAGNAAVELVNHTDFVLDLTEWTLNDERGSVQILADGLRLAARGSALVPCDACASGRASPVLALVDGASRVIHTSVPPPSGSAASISVGSTITQRTSPGTGIHAQPCDPGFTDVPGLDFVDENCDGIDGDITRAVFVATTGSPSNPGTMDQPLNDVNAALVIAAAHPFKNQVYVSEGNYPGLVTLVNGVSVWGGYSAANGWARSNAYVTTFSGAGVVSGNLVGVKGTNISSHITLGSVKILTSTAPANGNNYGLLLQACADVRLEGVTVVAGAGGTSSPGAGGSSGSSASNGTSGTSGGFGGNGGSGVYYGGDGGDGGHILGGGWDGEQGGNSGGGGGNGGGVSGNGAPGGNGWNGLNGPGGWPGSNQGYVANSLWQSDGTGATGYDGNPGAGGGGGGGGGGGPFTYGGAGGGGGGAGWGGHGGTGGTFGGTSFAVFLASSHVSIVSCNLTAGAGRAGGQGGSGAIYGNGAAGGNGSSTNASSGGHGGAGGHGGYGGGGGGGAGGNSYSILVGPQSSVNSLSSSTLSTSATGAGGAGGSSAGIPGQTGNSGEAVPFKVL